MLEGGEAPSALIAAPSALRAVVAEEGLVINLIDSILREFLSIEEPLIAALTLAAPKRTLISLLLV